MRCRLLAWTVFSLLLVWQTNADSALRKADKHFRADKQQRFAAAASGFSRESVYYPLIQYWKGILALRRQDDGEAVAYLANATESSPYFRNEMRRQLLEYYAGKNRWTAFARHAAKGGDCARVLLGFVTGDANADELKRLWKNDTRMNNRLCVTAYRQAKRSKVLTDDDIWIKLRELAGGKQLSASRRLLASFPGYVRYRKVRQVVNQAVRYIRGKHSLSTRADRELVMIAAMAAVRRQPKTAIARWQKFSPYFSKTENAHVWTALGEWAARWHRNDALTLYKRGDGGYANENARAWRVRAALRNADYADVLKTIQTMPSGERNLSAWRYWRAVALQQQGQDADSATAMRALAADEDDYYGLLAREAAGMPLVPAATAAAAATPSTSVTGDFALALGLYDAGLKSLALRVWRHAARNTDTSDEQKLAAARAAEKTGWLLASIDAANRTELASAYQLRFPLPFQNEITKHSRRFNLDAAFVYGLIRQESRFMPKIVSSANARGLMQVIPSTAKLVARKHKYGKYRLSRLTRIDTNVIIGTTYLSDLSDTFAGKPAYIAAAYNAGPGRAKRWKKLSANILVTIENISITETRLYVKHVLANRLHYAARMGRRENSMQTLINSSIKI